MSSALNQVFGGGGILGAALNIGSMFFPPLALANGLGNMLGGAIGGAIGGAADQLCKEGLIPKFATDIIKNVIGQVLNQNQKPCDNDCANHLQDKVGGAFGDFQKEMMKDFCDSFRQHTKECDKNGGTSTKGKSWFVAFMIRMGEIENKQADKVKALGDKVTDILGKGADIDPQKDAKGAKENEKAQFSAMEELKAEAKLQDVFANVVKSLMDSIGQALATAGRGQ
jgi:hypothetical protein